MAQKKRRARGEGSIRQRKDGTWEARFVVGVDPGTGKDIRKSVYAKTQKEVRQKMTEAVAALDKDDYKEPCKMTLGQWLEIWHRDYLNSVKPKTAVLYNATAENHIKPALGAVRLDALTPHMIQKFYNSLGKEKKGKPGLSPKTVKNVHGILHKALEQAVKVGYLRFNPADACELPRVVHKEVQPLDDDAISAFVKAVQGHHFAAIYLTMLFTGLRRGEACGLLWDCVDLDQGTIRIDKQLQNIPGQPGEYRLVTTKNSKSRTITVAESVVKLLRAHRAQQSQDRLRAGPLWQDGGFVFCNETGHHLSPSTVYHGYKKIAASIGLPESRLHDLRHSYAVAALRAGDDIKTVQGNLGHATASFTLDVYGHVTDQMKRESANRMQQYIDSIKTG